MTDKGRAIDEACILALKEKPDERAANIAKALLRWKAEGLREAVRQMRKRMLMDTGNGYAEVPDGAVPCWWLEKRAAEIEAQIEGGK